MYPTYLHPYWAEEDGRQMSNPLKIYQQDAQIYFFLPMLDFDIMDPLPHILFLA